MPRPTARRRTRIAPSRSFGSPQIPSPVMRIAPKPMRLTVRLPPSVKVPLCAAIFSRLIVVWAAMPLSMRMKARQLRYFNPGNVDSACLGANRDAGEGQHRKSTHRLAKDPRRLKDAKEQQVLKRRTRTGIVGSGDDVVIVDPPHAVDVGLNDHRIIAAPDRNRLRLDRRVEKVRIGSHPQRN